MKKMRQLLILSCFGMLFTGCAVAPKANRDLAVREAVNNLVSDIQTNKWSTQ